MSLRKIDESNVDVEPYTLNKKIFEWEKFFFSSHSLFRWKPGSRIFPFGSINQAAIPPRKRNVGRNVEGRGEHPSSNSLVGEGRKRDGRWSHQFKSSPSPLCTIQRRDSHRGRCRRDVIRWGGGRDVPGLSSFCEDYTGPFLSLHPSKGMEIRAYIRSRKRRVRVVCDRLTRTGSVERVIK